MPSVVRTARIVVQVTANEKRRIVAKAQRLGMSVSQLMCCGAASFDPELSAVIAREIEQSVARSVATIDATIQDVALSNARIAAMEAAAAEARGRR